MEDPIIESMSLEVKEWFAKAVVGMIWADGKVDSSEIAYLKLVIGFLKDENLVRSILDRVKRGKVPSLERIHTQTEEAIAIVKHLTSISIADEELDLREEKYLFYVSEQLGLSPQLPQKLLDLARKKLSEKKLTARLIVADESQDVVCFGLSKKECFFFSPRSINPLARVTLQLYKYQSEEKRQDTFHGITAKGVWCRAAKSPLGAFVVKVTFNHAIHENHGTALFQNSGKKRAEKTAFTPSANSLLGLYVTCRICGQKDIPFWQLRSKSIHSKANIFGIPMYDKPMGGMEYRDFNLIQVAICPSCLFASNQLDCFQRQGREFTNAPFDARELAKRWPDSLDKRKQMVGEKREWVSSERRSIGQGINSYQLAITTHDALGRLEANADGEPTHQRKSVSLLMTQAELLMNAGERKRAEKNLRVVEKRLESLFSKLENQAGIRAASLLVLIKIYFKAYDNVGPYLNFLKNYSRVRSVAPQSPESKALATATRITTEAWQQRAEYARDALKTFHLPH